MVAALQDDASPTDLQCARSQRILTTDVNPTGHRAYHDEVARALTAIGNPDLGEAIRKDRGSQLEHLGIRFPALRQRVKQGFSFYDRPDEEVLEVWDALWRSSPYGDVLFAALEYYAPVVRKRVSPGLWAVIRHWSARVDNWCHSDLLSGLYSRVLERFPDEVYPQIQVWNAAESEWLRRISIISPVHYSGKNAVFLPPEKVLPLVTNCLDDSRHYVQTAVGWVLREMGQVYPGEIAEYLEAHASAISASAFSRAIERRSGDSQARLREVRKTSLA
jgi:3-methyladenine DNA glycosylase AlkD